MVFGFKRKTDSESREDLDSELKKKKLALEFARERQAERNEFRNKKSELKQLSRELREIEEPSTFSGQVRRGARETGRAFVVGAKTVGRAGTKTVKVLDKALLPSQKPMKKKKGFSSPIGNRVDVIGLSGFGASNGSRMVARKPTRPRRKAIVVKAGGKKARKIIRRIKKTRKRQKPVGIFGNSFGGSGGLGF